MLYYFLDKIFSVLEAGGGAPDGDLIDARIGSKQVQMLGEDLKWEMVNTQVPIEMHGHFVKHPKQECLQDHHDHA